MKKLLRRKWLFIAITVFLALALLTLFCNLLILTSASSSQYTAEGLQQAAVTPHYDCILVLGALVRPDGMLSEVLLDRMDMGLFLLQKGYADTLLLSGDSAEPALYDEVGAMAVYALGAGAAESQILQDPLGLSTYESLWRAKYVYHAESVLIVTQAFHLPRAIYLADRLGLECAGVVCDANPYKFKNEVREVAARVKAVWDGLVQPEP